MGECRNIDPVLGKALRVLSETELVEPVRDLLHRGSTPRLLRFTRPHRQRSSEHTNMQRRWMLLFIVPSLTGSSQGVF